MASRRNFIRNSVLAGISIGMIKSMAYSAEQKLFSFDSPFIKLRLNRGRAEFDYFSTDSLGGGDLQTNVLLPSSEPSLNRFKSNIKRHSISYFSNSDNSKTPIWECNVQPKGFTLRTRWTGDERDATPFDIVFSQRTNHCTVLGRMRKENVMQFPCVLHFPGMGTFRVYCSDPNVTLFYDALRETKNPFVKLSFSAANKINTDIFYRFESVAIYPAINKIEGDKRFDGFRRNFINMIQMNPRLFCLANNSASDACAFTLGLYAEMARYMPELVEGLTALDLVRDSLDRYFSGMKGYGQVGYFKWTSNYDSCDSAPSLIMAACYYIIHTKDIQWGRKNYGNIKSLAEKMISTDRNKDGIIEFGRSGNSNSWDGVTRSANWWDTIGFGHDDAYSNALVYRACMLLSQVTKIINIPEESVLYDKFSENLKANYYKRFYNPETGVLAGWKSEDGVLHDYYFTFVNGVAITYGLIEEKEAKNIMSNLLDKMRAVGYTNFRLGLPGNLVKVANGDMIRKRLRSGYDAFQVYENGGATGCYAYYTIHALYQLGMRAHAEKILMPMLESYKEGDFEGYCISGSGSTKDWKTWTGDCWGYEGFLVDNYLTLLNVLDYSNIEESI